MQKRHLDPRQYFDELALTTRKYFLPYIENFRMVTPDTRILEIGCGCGGNLVPFAEKGCTVTGMDISGARVAQAVEFFLERGLDGRFICADIMERQILDEVFDLVIVHDVIEHISDKQALIDRITELLAPGGTVFMGFPAWQMPFGGHQQVCRNKVAATLPFYHLLPRPLYRFSLRAFGETPERIAELLDIKACRMTVERFTELAHRAGYRILDRRLYLINPHYETKFGLKPRVLPEFISGIPHLRNFLSTSCFFMIDRKPENE